MKKIALLCVVLVALTGCFGTFPATNKVIDLNRSPDTPVAQNAFFPILVPLYLAAIAGDLGIFNVAYFWKSTVGSSD